MHYDVLIIGGGAAGLMAMKELISAGLKVCLLEATERLGGRVATLQNGFGIPVEAGAEFVDEKASLTLDLLKHGNIEYSAMKGKAMAFRNGVWFDEPDREAHLDRLLEKINATKEDATISEFLDKYFPPLEYESLRKSVQQFSEGLVLADIRHASVLALRDEIIHQGVVQNRITGGYGLLIVYLESLCNRDPSVIHLNSPVDTIEYSDKSAVVHTTGKRKFHASKVIVTVSLGVLQSGTFRFVPEVPEHQSLFSKIAFGSVIKFLFRFKESFWQEISDNPGFLFTDEFIPTWWAQDSTGVPLLTGWLGGPAARTAGALPENLLLDHALSSLAKMFLLDKAYIAKLLLEHKIVCWDNLPFARGGYSYNIIGSDEARKALNRPIRNTVYFAGEACYSGPLQGTVEAALVSGKRTAELTGISIWGL